MGEVTIKLMGAHFFAKGDLVMIGEEADFYEVVRVRGDELTIRPIPWWRNASTLLLLAMGLVVATMLLYKLGVR